MTITFSARHIEVNGKVLSKDVPYHKSLKAAMMNKLFNEAHNG